MAGSNLEPDSVNFLEWFVTTIVAVSTVVIGYIMRTHGVLSKHSTELDQQKETVDILVNDVKEIKAGLMIRPTQEELTNLLHILQEILENRFDQLNNRLERIDGRIDSILRNP